MSSEITFSSNLLSIVRAHSYWQNYERLVTSLGQMGVIADVIVFHPYDGGHWGFDCMGGTDPETYVAVVVVVVVVVVVAVVVVVVVVVVEGEEEAQVQVKVEEEEDQEEEEEEQEEEEVHTTRLLN